MNGVKTVLLVDGDVAALVANSEGLQREGFHVQTAEDGGEALFHLAALPVDVLVLDLTLPTFSGTEVFKRIRADERLKDLPVVILSNAAAHKRPKDLSGPTQFLLKSETQFATLLQTIQELLRHATASGFSGTGDDTTFHHLASNAVVMDAPPATMVSATTSSRKSAAKEMPPSLAEFTAELPRIREDCFAYLKAPNTAPAQKHLTALRDRLNALHDGAKAAGCPRICLLAKPFHALVSGISTQACEPSPSILQTIAQALDCLTLLLENGKAQAFEPLLKPQALVVDDDPVSNEVNTTALQQADFDVTGLEDPFTALEILAGTPFDLIVLDVNMPKLTGFEVCEKLRQLPESKTTPVLFLTAFSNFENRKKSVLSGGGDFITKPVSTRELALKAATHLLKAQLRVSQKKTLPAQPSPVPSPRRLSASDLVSATESATSSLPGSDCLTLAPSLVNPPANTHAPDNDLPPMTMLANSEPERAASTGHPHSNGKPADLQAPMEPARAPSQTPAVSEAKIDQCKDLEQGLTQFLQRRESHQIKHASAEGPSSPPQHQRPELKEPLSPQPAGLPSSKATRPSADRTESEAELRKLLEVAQAAADKADAAVKEKEDNYRLLEEELIPLRKFRDQLQQKQQQGATELARVKAGLAQETAERAKSESELRVQLTAAKIAATEAETALKEKEESYHLLEEELAPLRRAREQFQEKQRQAATELERTKAQFAQASADHAKSQAELRQQLEAAKLELTQTEAALYRARGLEAQLSTLRQEHEQLQGKQQQAAAELERRQTELAQAAADRAKSEAKLHAELDAAKLAITQAEAALKENQKRAQGLEAQLSALGKEHQTLQAQQQQSAAGLERAKTELAQACAQHAKSQSEWRAQLEASQLATSHTQAALKESEKRAQGLEAQLSALRQEHEQLQGKQQQTVAELQRSKTEWTQASAEHVKVASELREKLSASQLAATHTQAALKEKEARCGTLEGELSTLRQSHDQFQQQSAADLKQVKAELKQESSERSRLEAEGKTLADAKAALDVDVAAVRQKLTLSQAKTLEAEQQIKAGLASVASLTADLEKERKERQRLEQRANSLASCLQGLHQDLGKHLAQEPAAAPAVPAKKR